MRKKTKLYSSAMVTSSNAFLRAHIQELNSVLFLRLFNCVAAQIQRGYGDFKTYVVPFTSLIPEGAIGGTYYKMINNLADEALKVRIDILESENRISKYSIISKCTLDSSTNTIEVNIHPDLKPHFIQLKTHFTQYQLKEFLKLSSMYSQRIYQILISWKGQSFWRVPIAELHMMLNSSMSMRKDFKEFRVKALEQAEKELLAETSLYFRWEAERVGRKVTHIVFYFEPQSDGSKAETQRHERIKLQSKSNACYEKHLIAGRECTPKRRSRICDFCKEQGRMSGKQERLFVQ